MNAARPFEYEGTELGLFARANHWREYWGSLVRPYLGRRVLEIGAGIGTITQALGTGEHAWTSVEPDPDLASQIRAASHGSLTVIVGSVDDVPTEPGFDSVLYIDVLEHIEDDSAEVTKAFARLATGGRLIILAPAHQWLFTPFDSSIGHFRRYSLASLRALRPQDSQVLWEGYLDSAGILASGGNRLLLRSAAPTPKQVALWDEKLVPISRLLDPLFRHRLGKSVLVVWHKAAMPI